MRTVPESKTLETRSGEAFSLKGKKVWVAGHNGMVGRALVRRLAGEDCELLTVSHGELDLTRQANVEHWMEAQKPDVILVAAARVGGINANNTQPAQFIYENTAIANNIIHAAHTLAVQKLLFLGSSCIYPRQAPQPIQESSFMTGPLEPTNQWYAIAKISGIMMCQAYRRQYGCDFISALPTNLYGPYDRYDAQASHVIPALMMKFHHAKIQGTPRIELWGTGSALREFLHVDDLADAAVLMIKHYSGEIPFNIGWGKEITIRDLASLMAKTVGYQGEIAFDATMPDGMPRKVLDTHHITALGWVPNIALAEGLAETYAWYCENHG